MKANSKSFPNIMEVSVEFGPKQICLGDTVAMELLKVNSLTLVVCLVDSSLISFHLKLLQRGLTSVS